MNIYKLITEDIRKLYLTDNSPWIIGFSGGKDSTTLLQMVFYTLKTIPSEQLTKEIHVLSNDTLVENPIVVKMLDHQLSLIEAAGKKIFAHNTKLFKVIKTIPKVDETFWVNVLGKGYPAPNRWFRWCTQRLKINPTLEYVKLISKAEDKVILLLGTRSAESANRAKSIAKYNKGEQLRSYLVKNVFVYAPITELSNDDVWTYLLQFPNLWGANNKDLIAMYRNASGGECPLVVETGTQSCGSSRFGCWTCTLVSKDTSLENLMDSGEDWLEDLLTFRDKLQVISLQNSQYVAGQIKKAKYGPLMLNKRKELLKELLEIQKKLSYELIAKREVNYIRKLHRQYDNHEEVKKYTCTLKNGKTVKIISDFNPVNGGRNRIGNMSLKDATVAPNPESMSLNYNNSNRVIFY